MTGGSYNDMSFTVYYVLFFIGATEPLNIKFADSGSYRKKTSTGII